jgi:hypothetical protein
MVIRFQLILYVQLSAKLLGYKKLLLKLHRLLPNVTQKLFGEVKCMFLCGLSDKAWDNLSEMETRLLNFQYHILITVMLNLLISNYLYLYIYPEINQHESLPFALVLPHSPSIYMLYNVLGLWTECFLMIMSLVS